MSPYLKTSNAVTIGFLAAMAWHFCTVFGVFGAVPVGQEDIRVRLFIILGILMVVAFLAAYILQQRHGGLPLLPDEREEKIERVSEGMGPTILYGGLLCIAWFAFTPLTPTQFVNGLLGVVTVAEFVKLLIVIRLHKKRWVR